MFNKNFVQILQIRNITAYNLSKSTGISQGLISDYKNGVKTPSADNLVKIADYLGCTTDFLLGRAKGISSGEEPTEEQRLLSAYRKLTAEGQKAVLMFAEVSAENPQYQKYTDISDEA